MNCPNCNFQNTDDAKFCNNCGYSLNTQQTAFPQQPAYTQSQNFQQPPIIINNVANANAYAVGGMGISPKSKMVTLLLCFFLGWLGIHRFYVGKAGSGILYLITMAVFGIGWLVDLIKILSGTFTDGAGFVIRK